MTGSVTSSIVRPHEPDLFNESAAGALILLFWIAGALAMLPLTASLLHLWHEDPLRSLGMLIPFVSVVLIVRAWRDAAWSWQPEVLAFLPLGLSILLARFLGDGLVTYRLRDHSIGLLQPGLFFFAYGSGVVLLLGGRRLWRASLFPLLLLFCVNPIPHLFNQFIDLPLQTASANTARAFAHVLGLQPTGEQLQMLFAPRFGMVIVPGCNGIRGSVTMGYLMLLFGYWRRYRPTRLAMYVAAAVALGYLLNLLRLCILVLYYWAGIHVQALRSHGEGIDYLIGGALFLVITALAGWILFRKDEPRVPLRQYDPLPWHSLLTSWQVKLAAALMLLCAFPEIPSAFAKIQSGGERFTSVQSAMKALPQTTGDWHLGAFSFERQEADGQIIWIWAPYTHSDGRTVDLGVWLSPLQHYALNSRRIRGESPSWTGTLEVRSARGEPVRLSAFAMQDDFAGSSATPPTLFAETTCWTDHPCSDASMVGFGKQGLSIAIAPLSTRSQLRLSLLLRSQQTDRGESDQARASAESAMRDLLSGLDLRQLTRELGTVGP